MTTVAANGALHISHLVAECLCLRAIKAQVANSTTNTTALFRLLQREAVHKRNLLHTMGPRILKLRTLRIQQRHDEFCGHLNLLLRVSLDVNMLRHMPFLISLKFVPNILATDEYSAARCLLQASVIDTSCSNDDTHERSIGVFLIGNQDLFHQPLWFPSFRRHVVFHVFQHVPDQSVPFRQHGLLDADVPGVKTITLTIVDRRGRGRSDVRFNILKLPQLNLPIQIFQALLSQKLVHL
mmetsp:Transcript_78531/g.123894  ORF Transcript_78531/g.123894 Transcript_78531/m.123894 type:complete len:239 (+) Transcript_78531:1114-1830(+)